MYITSGNDDETTISSAYGYHLFQNRLKYGGLESG